MSSALGPKNKLALITGSSRGIGRIIALKMAAQKYTVILTGRNLKDLEDVKNEISSAGGQAVCFEADLTVDDGVKKAAAFVNEKFGYLDVLVTNIGSGKTPLDLSVDIAEWKRIFDINFFSAVLATNHFMPLLEKNSGQIVCISSIAGIEKIAAPISYSVAKAAVISFVQNMMRPLAEKKMRINSISPGNVWIENGSWGNKMKQDPDRVQDIIKNQVALKKFVQPEEIANAVLFITENDSITGQNFIIDGGQTRQT